MRTKRGRCRLDPRAGSQPIPSIKLLDVTCVAALHQMQTPPMEQLDGQVGRPGPAFVDKIRPPQRPFKRASSSATTQDVRARNLTLPIDWLLTFKRGDRGLVRPHSCFARVQIARLGGLAQPTPCPGYLKVERRTPAPQGALIYPLEPVTLTGRNQGLPGLVEVENPAAEWPLGMD